VRPPFSRLRGGLRIGSGFFAKQQALSHATVEPPRGLVDRMADLANPGLEVGRIHPAIAVFFEDTARLELQIRSHWRFPFSVLWWLGRPIMRWIGQFVLPADEARIVTRVLALDPARDGRSDARGIIREYTDTGAVMQVAAYATWEHAGARYMSAAFPLPGGHITGILRLDPIGEDDEGRIAVVLTSKARDGDDAGIWAVVGSFGLRVPLGESIAFWAAGMRGAPADLDRTVLAGATILGRHEQRVFGVRFVTHDYWFRPRSP
jgi:hypothetical protein